MADVHRTGFTELSNSDGIANDQYQVNIIFVHGLRGHPRKTWEDSKKGNSQQVDEPSSARKPSKLRNLFKSKASASTTNVIQKLFWPKDYLVDDVPRARIWTYGYNADVVNGLFQANNKNSVSPHGRDLAVQIERDIDNEDPFLFVAHSLGGIIVKDAMHRSEACRLRTKLIVFLGTPHRGAEYAGWGETAANLACFGLTDSHKKIIKTLEVDNEVLDNIHEEFKSIVNQHETKIHSFQEARGISGMKGLHNKVVGDFSSKLDLSRSQETVESIDANHMEMARCSDKRDPQYRAISGVLKSFMRRRVSETNRRETLLVESQAGQEVETIGAPSTYIIVSFPRNHRFVERAELKVLEDKFFISKDCQKIALVGLGGVGKTQVALEFAYSVKAQRPEYSIFWLPALSAESFEQAYREIATQCCIITNEGEDPKKTVQRYLSKGIAGKWLIIVDNADDHEVLFGPPDEPGITDYLPENEDGLTLFTTRHREAAVWLAKSDVVELQEMSLQEAQIFLEKSLIRKELCDSEKTTELLNELTCLPLAIAQAAAYLNIISISVQEYLLLLRSTEQEMVSLLSREFRDSTRYKNSKNAVATTWLVSFDQIRKFDSDAADLLSFISCVESKAIPRSMLPPLQPEERIERAIGILRTYAFVTRRGDSNMYDMHRLMHLATRLWVQKDGIATELSRKTIQHLAKLFPTNNYTSRALWKEYFPHALQLLRGNEGIDIEDRYWLCLKVGNCLKSDGRISEAVTWLSECFQWMKKYSAEDHPDRLASQHELAGAYRADGQVGKALALLEHVVAIEKNVLTADHPSRLASQHALAGAYQADGQVEKAVALWSMLSRYKRSCRNVA